MIKIEKKTGLDLLRVPFPPNQIGRLPKPTKKQTEDVKNDFKMGIRCKECGQWHHKDVVHLDYVGHAALTDRLLDADPAWIWSPLALTSEGLPLFDKSGGLWINLTVCGVTRLGYGHATDKQGGDREKEVIGDALRNAAMRFGAALELWHKGDLHGDEEAEVRPVKTEVTPPKPPPKTEPLPEMIDPVDQKSLDLLIQINPQPLVNHSPSKNGISEAQGKRLFALQRKAGWKDFELKDVLDRVYNVTHSLNLDRVSYKELTDFLDANGTYTDLLKQKGL